MRWRSSPTRFLCGSCLATLLIAASCAARAQEEPATAVVSYSPNRQNWEGFYAGIHAGYTWGDADGLARWGNAASDYEYFAYGTRGAEGGLHAGYNHQLDNAIVGLSTIVGLEADISASEITGAGHSTANMVHSTLVDWITTVRLRLGFAAKNTMFYVAGGPALTHVETTQRMPNAVPSYTQHEKWKLGWTIGGGVEQAITPKLSLRLDYRYIDLGKMSYDNSAIVMAERTKIDSHSVRAGVSFKF